MLNKVILMGRLTKDPELKYTSSNVPVCSFTIAVDRRFVKQGEQKQADFINCVAWRQNGEFISKYFSKGDMINVCGSLQNRNWDDANGVRHYATEVIVDEANFCGGNSTVQAPGSFPNNQDDYAAGDGFVPVDTDDDLPF